MVGESGSGKSTIAKQMQGYLRLSRDDLRIELAQEKNVPTGRRFEDLVAKVQMSRAGDALERDQSVVIDDTNLSGSTRAKWENFARHTAAFRVYRVLTPLETCIAQDNMRVGKSHVGAAVIYRQFTLSGRLPIDMSKKIVICDIDGTLANMAGKRGPYEENKVLGDDCYTAIRDEINRLAVDHTVIIVSGRHSTCGDDTIKWLNLHGVKFDFILMRHGWDNSPDYVVKQEILNELLKIVPKEQIEVVFDDRPQVCTGVWAKNGIPLRVAFEGKFLKRWTTKHDDGCKFPCKKGYRRCPNCGALEDF